MKKSKPIISQNPFTYRNLFFIALVAVSAALVFRIIDKDKSQSKTTSEVSQYKTQIEELEKQVKDLEATINSILNEPTPTPLIIYKYIEKKTDNSEKIKKIDEQIARAREEIRQLDEKLKENPYSQNNQARKRDLLYQIGILELEKIKYE